MDCKLNLKTPGNNVSTLLVPVSESELFRRKLRRFGSVGRLLHYLLRNENRIMGRLKIKSARICYQEKGEYTRVSFRPAVADWEMLRIYALSRRMSMALLFVLLLKGVGRGDEVPTLPPPVTLTTTLRTDKSSTYLLINRLNQ